jgi:hypothetical protein
MSDREADRELEQSAVDARRGKNSIAFGLQVGSAWGGAYGTERDVTSSGSLQVIYDNGQAEPVEFTILAIGIGVTYERGSSGLRFGGTFLGRFDDESYTTNAPAGYQQLTGDGLLAWRVGLFVGPGFTLAQSRMVSLDGRLELGGVMGGFRPLAGVADAVGQLAQNVTAPTEATLVGVGGRAWLAVMFGAPHGKTGGRGGFGVLYEGTWEHAKLFAPWPDSWFEHGVAAMGLGQVLW